VRRSRPGKLGHPVIGHEDLEARELQKAGQIVENELFLGGCEALGQLGQDEPASG